MKVSLAITVFNEEESIVSLLESIMHQIKRPDEVIIVDGGSNDTTVERIKEFINRFDKKRVIKLFKKKCNRPEGRNLAIAKAKFAIIAITDAGCILHRKWLKEITDPFKDKNTDIVSGYYKTLKASTFEQAVAAYTLVMPDKIDPKQFLPSARSMAIRKIVWKKAGGFPIEFPLNEDYVFARKLKRLGKQFSFTKKAIVYWKPRENILKAFLMFFYFSTGDSMAGILRPKVFLIFVRYVLVLWLLVISFYFSFSFMLRIISYILLAYVLWSIWKNYKYVRRREAFIFLPILQFTSDIAVILGTSFGFFKSLWDTQKRP